MTISITISKKKFAVLLALIGLIGAVSLVSANHDQNIIHACLKKDGTIIVVAESTECKKHDEAITLATEGAIVSLEAQNSSQQAQLDDLDSRISVLEYLLAHFSRNGDDIFISGANLNIVNGLNNTLTTNSLGNVIIGYNEFRGSGNDRTGSHVLIVGSQHNFSSYGGVVFGLRNESGAPFATVSGGRNNVASGARSSVTGGDENEASGGESSVTGGNENKAIGNASTVSGGSKRTASGVDSWAAGSLYEPD